MQIYFTYDKNQAVQALRYHFISRQEIKVLLVLVNVFAIIAAILLALHKVSPLAFLVSSVLWILLMATFWLILPRMVYRKSPTFKDAFTMTFEEDKVRLENLKGFVDWRWEKFSGYMESPNFIHLYFNSRSFFLVPKQAVEKDGDLNSLRALLQAKLKRL